MDNINKDNLVKFVSYFIIVFLLSLVLYLMYTDFISESFFSKTERFSDENIENKLKIINSHVVEHLSTTQIDPLIFDPNSPYFLKKDLLSGNNQIAITDALCGTNDITFETDDNKLMCKINQNNLYLSASASNKYSIKVLPDGIYTTPDENNFSYYDYDVTISDIDDNNLSETRKSYFYFPDNDQYSIYNSTPRNFTHTNKYDMGILNYFNNYAKYNNYINRSNQNELIVPPIISSTPSTSENNNLNLINKYFTDLENLLLLKNSEVTSPFVYDSGYSFDINNIKSNLINNLYTPLLINSDSTIKFNMTIDDTTSITCYYDSPDNMNVYTFELNPSITITFNNLTLTYSDLPENIKAGTIWSLYYVTALTPTETSDNVFSYSDLIQYPIALPFATPIVEDWKINTTNGFLTYIKNIFKRKINNMNILDNNDEVMYNTDGEQYAIQSLGNLLRLIGNANLSSITDIFLLYDPIQNIGQSWAITNIVDETTKNLIIAPLLRFNMVYTPNYCPIGLSYNQKCIPGCPDGFNYDFGLVCLNNNPVNYFPESSMCEYLNKLELPEPINPVINALKISCDKNYFDNNRVVRQADITGSTTLPTDPLTGPSPSESLTDETNL